MKTQLIEVFVVLDLMLFYIFFESVLIPMFLVVGIWAGSVTRVRASFFTISIHNRWIFIQGVHLLVTWQLLF